MERGIVRHRCYEGGRGKIGLGNLPGRGEGELDSTKAVWKSHMETIFMNLFKMHT